jgi:uncharacterized protein
MSAQSNVETVREMYAAFEQGDVPSVLAPLSDDVVWWVGGPSEIPYAGTYRGREGVAEFFNKLGGAVVFESMEPQEFVTGPDSIAVLGSDRTRVRSTGKPLEKRWAMVFDFEDGRVCGFRAFEDTAAIVEAFRA